MALTNAAMRRSGTAGWVPPRLQQIVERRDHRFLDARVHAVGLVRAVLARLAAQERYLACELDGRRYDFGVKYGLLTAQLALALSGKDRDEVLRGLVELLATR